MAPGISATAEALQDFFPTLLGLLGRAAPCLVARMHAGSPDPRVALGALSVRFPLLLPLAALGAAVGLRGHNTLTRGAGARGALPSQGVWALAFLYFAAMNLSAIACHCLAPRATALHRLAAALDVAFTGCSSACLVWASAAEAAPPSSWLAARRAWAAWLWAPIGAAALAGNLLFPAARLGLNEATYLGTTAAAVATLFANEVLPAPPRSAEAGHVRAAARAALAAAALAAPLDPALRRATGGWLGGLHSAFLGCDAAFAALGAYLVAKRARLAAAKGA
ncbi:MAG: hypothetical protein J3K34DRAFT_524277 [Monoraphidium minutum]|nr:MAG: hypothetical protein J3K34DRAFT_524277 [Monoraphidium minutum]